MTGGCALVTGASRGIGAACARALAADGMPVAVNYRSDADGAAATVAAIEAEGGQAQAIQGDVADPDCADHLFRTAEERLGGPVLVLVNNAGVRADNLSPQIDDADWDAVIDTNLTAAFRLTRRALRPMMKARYGRVVNMSSVVGQRANPGQANYAASKAGLIAMTKTVAAEVARRKVTVNAVAPGLVDTDMTEGLGDELLKAVPARRAGTPDEVAACVRFLVSDEAAYVTGSVLTVDGGMTPCCTTIGATQMSTETVSRETIESRVADALVEFGAEREDIGPDAKFESLDVDSLDLVELAQIVEEDYGVQITGENMKSLDTVGKAVDFVEAQLAQERSPNGDRAKTARDLP